VKSTPTTELRLPALRIRQGDGQDVYSFAADGKKLRSFAAVSRVKRTDGAEMTGYQRPEAIKHIQEIKRYLESEAPLMPNAVVVAFDERVRFEPLKGQDVESDDGIHGTLVIPIHEGDPDAIKPGWLVDGQQRTAALRDARVDRFPVYVTAFVAKDETQQRSQFILVNATKPLPKGLIHELLPSTDSQLPIPLLRKRLPAYLVEQLNFWPDGPLNGRIRTPTVPEGTIKDNSVLRMLERSISDGCLYRYRDPETGWGDTDAMLEVLNAYWSAVAEVFPKAWNLPPRESRLVHGVGFVSLGALMDEIVEGLHGTLDATPEVFRAHVEVVASACAWTDGFWGFGPNDRRRWNDLQNTGREIQKLSDFLIETYRAALAEEMKTAVQRPAA